MSLYIYKMDIYIYIHTIQTYIHTYYVDLIYVYIITYLYKDILLYIYIQQMLGTILQSGWFYMRKGSKRQDMGNLNKKNTACTGTYIVKFMAMQSDGLQENMGSGCTLKPPAGVNQMRQRSM